MNHANRLIREKSPYLLQHAYNPVDWYPWGEEAFDRARREDKPVFLSIGYSTCRWCHIMEREVFEDPECAQILNQRMVSIKVDREERPDLDHIYMTAAHILAGSGGWPLSAFLLPDGRPFYGGTYFPPGQFKRLVMELSASYRDRRKQIEEAAREVTSRVSNSYTIHLGEAPATLDLVARTLLKLEQEFDPAHGGFGVAPKFPPHGALALVAHALRTGGRSELRRLFTTTLDGMALGGLHDHVGGGFHRYSTDAAWFLPHFEKMLYDNALLSRSYVDGYLLTGDQFYRRVAEGIYQWIVREMIAPEGAFLTAMDAESEGAEGRFYLWQRDEVMQLLGEEDGSLLCRAYQVTEEGNYRDERSGLGRTGLNILHLGQRLSIFASSRGLSPDALEARMARARARLLVARDQRERPFTDDKIITAWNGLMIASLAYAARHFHIRQYVHVAESAAHFLLTRSCPNGRLRRRWREGETGDQVFLDDHAFLAQGLLELQEATGSSFWLEQARRVMEEALASFRDGRNGDFFFTPSDTEALFARPKELFDQPVPSSNGMAAQVLVRLAALTGEKHYRAAAEEALHALSPWIAQISRGAESLALAAAMHLERRD